MVFITAIEMGIGGSGHEHIVSLYWQNPESNQAAWSDVAGVVQFIEAGGVAKTEGPPPADISVRTSESGRKYVQTYVDGYWSNNLLNLPRA